VRTYESEAGEKYTYICSVHDDIRDYAQQIQMIAEKIIDIEPIAKDMGINMEDHLMRRKTQIEEMQQEIDDLKKEVRKYKTADKRRKAAKEKKLDK